MENLLQKFCLTLVGVFSLMNFSTYPQRSVRMARRLYHKSKLSRRNVIHMTSPRESCHHDVGLTSPRELSS